MGLLQPGFGGDVQRLIQLVAALHIFPFHVNVAVAAHPVAAVVSGKIQVLDEVNFRRQYQRRQESVHRFLAGRFHRVAVVGYLPTVVGDKGRQQNIRVFADLVSLNDGIHYVLGVFAMVVHPVNVTVHYRVLVVGADNGRRLKGAVGHYNDNGNASIGGKDKLLRRNQQAFGVGGKGAAGAGLGSGYLGVHHAAFMLQFNDLGGQLAPLNHPGQLFTDFIGGADGEIT